MALALFSRALARPAFTRLSGATSWQRFPRCNSLAAASAAPAGGRSQAEGWRLQHAASGSSAACVVPPKVADLIDLHCGGPFGSPEQQASPLRVLAPGLRHYGGVRAFCGQVATIQCWESNVQVHEVVKEPGAGKVLVVDNSASLRAAVLGDILAGLAHKHGWAGIVVNGCVRDVAALRSIPIGLMALDSHPMKPGKGPAGQRGVPVVVGGVAIRPGDYLYADEDGVLVSPAPLELPDAQQLAQLQALYHSKT
ncbi:hypothetical protein ABPG77_002798 [Micractinium sp. CCAP 211/92]